MATAPPFTPLAPDVERALVLAAQAGDPDAIRALYDAYHDRIGAILLFSIGDPVQVQDVLQAVFLKVFRGLGGFRFRSSVFTWIYRIARNECLNHLRRREAERMPLDAILGAREEADTRRPANPRDGGLDRDLVLRDAVARLPAKMREVIVLRYLEGLSYEEMSRALGCRPGTVASRLNRALAELGDRLAPMRRLL